MKINGKKGQITVFLCIIMLAVIILAGVLVDASRVSSGRSLVRGAVRSAAKSVLAGYDNKLKESYGLFSIHTPKEELEAKVRHYLEKTLQIQQGITKEDSIDFYDFRIEGLNVEAFGNFSENRIFRQQILEYMKYRAPKEMVEGFVERLKTVKDMGKMSSALSKKVSLDKMLGKLDKAQQSLKKLIDGSGEVLEKCVNSFNTNEIWNNTFDSYLNYRSSMADKQNDLYSLETELEKLKEEICIAGQSESEEEADEETEDETDEETDEGSESTKEVLEKKIKSLQALKEKLTEEIESLESSASASWTKLRNEYTVGFRQSNEKAIKAVERLLDAGGKAQELVGGLERFLEISFAPDNEFAKTLKGDIDKIQNLLLRGQEAAEMVKSLQNNLLTLELLEEKLELLKEQALDHEPGNPADIIRQLVLKYDKQINYLYEKPVKEGNKEDPRKDKLEALKDALLEKAFDDKNFGSAGINRDELPSRKKVESKSFDDEDATFIDTNNSGGNDAGMGKTAEYEGELGALTEEADLYDEEGMFQENAFNFLGSIGDLLEGSLLALRDNIYINEYIIGMFKNHVASVKSGKGASPFTFLNGISREDKETFFDCEVEYILHGNSSEIVNQTLTGSQIMLLRLASNTLHVYSDTKKRSMAMSTATVVAGWWTGGAGIPVISNLIMCAWGMGESIIDLKLLNSGEALPIYKLPGDWRLDIGIPAAGGAKADARLYFSYHDYLRLFLLAMDENEKLGRMEDLVEINAGMKRPGFKAGSSNTCIRIEAEISIKNLFISRPFMPDNLRTKDGRQVIKVLVYDGY